MKGRTFIAINLPAVVKDDIAAIVHKLQKMTSSVKWVRRENLHVTLHFLGDIEGHELDHLKEIIKEYTSSYSPIDFVTRSVSAFPDSTYPRVIIISIVENHNLSSLVTEMASKISAAGIGKDNAKPFNAHITIGRVKGNVNGIHILLGQKFVRTITVRSIDIMKSTLNQNGATYNIIEQYKL